MDDEEDIPGLSELGLITLYKDICIFPSITIAQLEKIFNLISSQIKDEVCGKCCVCNQFDNWVCF